MTEQTNQDELMDGAVIYARVSSTGQLGRDGDEDGYSIPAQVKACEAEAASRGAKVVKVYIERAESAKTDDRPVLQQMLRELPSHTATYLIVHKVDRLARNRLDDAVLYQKLVGMGITLVSASENIDDTPAGQLMHGMLATFAEYYSNNLSTEIMKGLRRKHETGGTPHKPPIGYMSKRELIGNQDIRTVVLDPERAPFVTKAFTLYATGHWPLLKLAEHLKREGLRSRGTRRYPERPLGANRLSGLLRNPYYMGIVVWNGRRYPGKHEPLIDPDTFDRVQALLTYARQHGERAQKHEHYLRGTVVCDECHGRLLYGRHRGRSGCQYEYFSCNNRTARRKEIKCGSGYYSVEVTERHVLDLYRTLVIPAEVQERIRAELRQELVERSGLIQNEAERHERAIKQIKAKQEKLLQLWYADAIDEDVFAREQHRLKAERQTADDLRKTAAAELEDVTAALELALSRVDRPYEVYRDATPLERRVLNHAIFERIEVGPDAEITSTKLTPAYEALSAWEPSLGRPKLDQGATEAQDEARSIYVRPTAVPVHQKLSICKRSCSLPIIWYINKRQDDLRHKGVGMSAKKAEAAQIFRLQPGARFVDNALRVLDCLGETDEGGMTICQLAAASDVHEVSLKSHLRVGMNIGIVVQVAGCKHRHYRLGGTPLTQADYERATPVTKRPAVPPLLKSLWLLSCFTNNDPRTRLEIAEATGFSLAVVIQTLAALVKLGYVRVDPGTGGRAHIYYPGPKLSPSCKDWVRLVVVPEAKAEAA